LEIVTEAKLLQGEAIAVS